MNQLKTGIILNYVNLAISSLIPFLYTPIMLSLLGQQEYGLYKLSGSITSYLSLISLGLGAAITRYLIKARTESGIEEERKILGLFIIIFNVIAIITILGGIILSININHWYDSALSVSDLSKMKILIFILTCNMAINFLATPYISIVNAHEKFIFLQSLNIFTTILGPILNLVALYLGYASIGLAISSLIATILFRAIYYLYVKHNLHITPLYDKSTFPLLKEILIFSFWVFISNIVGQLYGATDAILIGSIPTLATIGVAIYSIGDTFNSIIFTLNAGISSLLIPKANKMVFNKASNDEITDTAIRLGRIQCMIIALFVFGFIAFGQPFIHFYAGNEYKDAYWIAIICMIPNMIPLIQSFCLNILIAKNKNKFRAIVYLIIAILNVIGTWYLLKIWGIIGAAIMTGTALFLGQGITMNWFYHKKMNIDILRFWKHIVTILMPPMCMTLFTLYLYNYIDFFNIKNLVLGIGSYTFIYIIINWFFIMRPYEKKLIKI